MSEGAPKSGLVVSSAMHLALLGMLVVSFSRAPRFDDASESIPVDTISLSQMNEIMEGQKEAKPAPTPAPAARGETETPPPPEPPADLRKTEEAVEPPPPSPPPRPEPEPPQKPAPPKAASLKPAPEPPPKPTEESAPTPAPPVKPKTAEKPIEKPPERPPEKPVKPAEKPDRFRPDQVARLLAKAKAEDAPKPAREAPKSAVFDKNAIAKLLGTKTADAGPSAAASQGLQNHHAQRMSVSLENALNEWFTDEYLRCWTPPPTTPPGENYVFDVRVTFNPDGSLSAKPVMTNQPRDPAWRPHAESAMRAVLKCNPLPIPSQYAPYFEQWKTKTIHFDPTSAQG